MYEISEVVRDRDYKLWKTITEIPPMYSMNYYRLRDNGLFGSVVTILYYLQTKRDVLKDLLLIDAFFMINLSDFAVLSCVM